MSMRTLFIHCTDRMVDTRKKSTDKLRFAIADGASESSFSREWAKILAHSYYRGKFDVIDMVKGGRLQQVWTWILRNKELSWFAEEKMRRGAFSSLAGITLYEEAGYYFYEIFAIGDSCIFHVRDNELIAAWPISKAEEFNNSPFLISSILSGNSSLYKYVHTDKGSCSVNDEFFLMTDALSCWFLQSINHHLNYEAEELILVKSQHKFRDKINHLRGKAKIRNDDTTMVRLCLI